MSARCHCGQPLHYSRADIQAAMEEMIQRLGSTMPVTVGGRTWMVPRHYIALHGLKAVEMPFLGFEEVNDPLSQ